MLDGLGVGVDDVDAESAPGATPSADWACSQAKLRGDDGVSVREVLVVLALDVLTWPWPGTRGLFLDDDVPDVEFDRVGRDCR